MQVLYPAMIVAGVAAIAWGLPAAHRLRRPFDNLAAFLVLVGTAVALLGALLAAVPGFFSG
jgi:ABC-type dipeptide/oligopeptide/nickel transport system permease component